MRWMLALPAALAAVLCSADPGPAAAEAFSGEAVLGEADAPVTVIEYASMTCPHCAQFHANALPTLKEEYIATGKVKLVYRDFPLDAAALKAAMVARCGGADRHLAFVDVIYGQQQRWARSPDPVAALKQLVQIGGLSPEEVDACLADKSLETAILERQLAGQTEHEVQSMPTFIVNGDKHVGVVEADAWREVLDPLVAAGG